MEVAARALDECNVGTFAHFSNPIDISTLEIRPQYNSTIGARLQYFALGRIGLTARLPLYFKNSEHTEPQLTVSCGAVSMSLAQWLEGIPKPAQPDIVGEAGYKMLDQYHQAKRAHKAPQQSFSTMPDDLQENILLHMLGEVRPVGSFWAKPRMHDLEKGRSNEVAIPSFDDFVPYGPPKIEPIDLGIFRLDKKTRNMIIHVFKYRTIKSFDYVDNVRHVLRDGTDFDLSTLTRIQLALSDEEYLDFFGAKLINTPPRPGPYDAAGLAKLPNLRYLELWFRTTVHADSSNPWKKKSFSRKYEGVTYQFPCRKGMVDAIMIAAIPHIEHVESINLTGYVKTQTREEWLMFWADKHSVTQQSMLEAKKEALQYPPGLRASSLRCKCRVSCLYPGVSDAHHANISIMLEGWALVRNLRSKRRFRIEAIENYRFDFDDTMPVSEYREQDCFPIPFEEYKWV